MATQKMINQNIQYLKGVGPKTAGKLNKLGIETVSDLLMHFPRAYKDFSRIIKIKDLVNRINKKDQIRTPEKFFDKNIQIKDGYNTIKVKVLSIENRRTKKRGFTITEAVVADDTGSLAVVWFNQPFLKQTLKLQTEVLLNGEVKYNRYLSSYVLESPDWQNKTAIVAIYPETVGVTSAYISRLINNAQSSIYDLQEFLPMSILKQQDLIKYRDAVWQLHKPENGKSLSRAMERFAFDELFFATLQAQINKAKLKKWIAPRLKTSKEELNKFVKSLPFQLTNDQKRVAWQIALDLSGQSKEPKSQKRNITVPMNRLLNGDVGSGKTVVAAFAIFISYRSGYKSVFMAPTQILANQHLKTLKKILEPFGMKIALVTAETSKKMRKSVKPKTTKKLGENSSLKNADLIIGTQAILHLKDKFLNLGLVLVDEQHRFGVKQRAKIKEMSAYSTQNNFTKIDADVSPNNRSSNGKGCCKIDLEDINNKSSAKVGRDIKPHFLSMTATPIPRTLHLGLFSDLDISRIREMPKGRKKIITKYVQEGNRMKAYAFIKEQIAKGRQAFVVCPLIEEDGTKDDQKLFDIDKKSVLAEYKKLKERIFPDLKIAMLHGKMKAREKDKIMDDFAKNKINILVSTSVIEVGIDVPNASIMMIENGERFGLAQLHQFRGRIGRGDYQSYCFILSNAKNQKTVDRLKSFEKISDGFTLAEIDLNNRGAGQIYGEIQSGHYNFVYANLSDRILLDKAKKEAEKIVKRGIGHYPKLVERISEMENQYHLE